MGEISISVDRIGRFSYSTNYTDCDDPKSDYVSMFEFRNAGKTIFGDTPWWQTIRFSSPDGIEDLIEALTYARMRTRDDMHIPSDRHECVVTAVARANNECKAFEADDGWECEYCGCVTSSSQGKPTVCANCGSYFDGYIEREDE